MIIMNYGTILQFIINSWYKVLDKDRFNPNEIQRIFCFSSHHEQFDEMYLKSYGDV